MNWHWPATEHNDWMPWYKIAWRAPWFAAMFVLVVIASLLMWACTLDGRCAEDSWTGFWDGLQ